jgi:hypothetical protein
MDRGDIRVGQIYCWGNVHNDGRYEVVSIGHDDIIFKQCSSGRIIHDPYPINDLIRCIEEHDCTLESDPNEWALTKFRFV